MQKDGRDIEVLHEWGEDIYPKLSWFKQDKVQAAHVMVVGCGALGNEVLKNLVLFGVGHLVLVDYDCIEASNLTRSILFLQADAEACRYKVEVAAQRLRQINPAVRILTINGNITHDVGLGLLRRMDVVIGCVDNRYARYCLNRMCMRAGVPWIDGGIDGLEGTARVFAPEKNCYACNLGPEGLKELSRRLSCSLVVRKNEEAGRVPTTPVIASIIGAVQAQEAMKLIHKEEVEQGEMTSLCGKMFYYEGQHLTSKLVDFQAYDEDCSVHERWSPLIQSELTVGIRVRDALACLSDLLQGEQVEILLQDNCFVDYISERANDRRTHVMLPNYAVADFVEQDERLRYLSLGSLYQHEIHAIGADFPYSELTLKQIGIPERDVLHVVADGMDYYVEMNDELNIV